MKALISPIEDRFGGLRIAEVAAVAFEVAGPFYWVDVPDGTTAETHYWDPVAGQAVANPAPAADPTVPKEVSRFQARAALYQAGYLTQVEALMADPATDMLARLAWQDAAVFRRSSPSVQAMSAALGLTAAQLDQLFITAASIVA